ncbi:hypothetical protein PUF88_00960 [Lactobacillaceae bacterium L1_55_11]|nr:hypothetical protein [Lactobacillaceae bacterium L1_55_11]
MQEEQSFTKLLCVLMSHGVYWDLKAVLAGGQHRPATKDRDLKPPAS